MDAYNSFARKPNSTITALILSTISLSLPIAALAGETIDFPGDGSLVLIDGMYLAPSSSVEGKSNSISGNSISVNGATVSGSVSGARNNLDADPVRENNVFINSGATAGRVYGGVSSSADLIGNTINIHGSVDWSVYGGDSLSGDVVGNTVNIHGAVGAYVYGGLTRGGDAIGNTVTLNSGTVGLDVTGAYTASGNAIGNTVIINDGVVGRHVYGGESRDSNAIGNTATLNGGTVEGDIFGGYSSSGDATGNTVNIRGSVGGYVYGGYGEGAATGNTVTFNSGSVAYDVFGGDSGSGGDAFTGNTLNVKGAGLTVGGNLKNFQSLNFYLPSTTTTNTTMLTVGGEADLTNGAGGSSTVNVAVAGGSSPLKAGDRIILIKSGTLTTANGLNTTANGQGMQGISLRYEFDILADTTNNELLAIVTPTGATLNPQTKALSEGRLSGAAFVTQGADMVTGIGMQAMQTALGSTNSVSSFGIMQGSTMRHDTGSHVDVDGVTLMAGAAKRNAFNQDNLTLGAFVEAGWGNYDSYNSFSNAASVHGDGDTNYYGVGLMGRLDMSNGLYADSTLRVGRVETDFKANLSGLSARYDSQSTYTGLSLGLGKIFKLDEQKNLDIYGRYVWTHINSDNVNVAGDPFSFDSINSHRLRAGLRYTNQFSSTSSFYAGAAYDHEFDGDAGGSVLGHRIDTPSLEGGTGVFELGMTLRPQNNERLSVDMGLQGYVGQREGVAGSVKANYVF